MFDVFSLCLHTTHNTTYKQHDLSSRLTKQKLHRANNGNDWTNVFRFNFCFLAILLLFLIITHKQTKENNEWKEKNFSSCGLWDLFLSLCWHQELCIYIYLIRTSQVANLHFSVYLSIYIARENLIFRYKKKWVKCIQTNLNIYFFYGT